MTNIFFLFLKPKSGQKWQKIEEKKEKKNSQQFLLFFKPKLSPKWQKLGDKLKN